MDRLFIWLLTEYGPGLLLLLLILIVFFLIRLRPIIK